MNYIWMQRKLAKYCLFYLEVLIIVKQQKKNCRLEGKLSPIFDGNSRWENKKKMKENERSNGPSIVLYM